MAISAYVHNAQRVTKAIEGAFVGASLEKLPELVQEYRQAIMELAMSSDAGGLHSNPDVSLQAVAQRLLQMRTKEGYAVLNHNLDAEYISAIIATLPIDVQMADALIRLPSCPIDRLCEKLVQTQYSYQIDMESIRFLSTLAEKNPAITDRVLIDILDGKSQFGFGIDIPSLGAVIKIATTLNNPSTRLLSLLKTRSPEFIKRIDSITSSLKALSDMVKLPLITFANLKVAGCDDLINKIMQADGMDFKATDPMDVFFKAGGVLPDAFLTKALGSDKFNYSMYLAFLEVLVKPTTEAIEAIEHIRPFLTPESSLSHNSMAERWFKSLGDSIEIAVRLGYKPDKSVIVGLIEAVAENINNPVILKGSTLASGIDGRYLAVSPSLKAFKGDYVHQELGL